MLDVVQSGQMITFTLENSLVLTLRTSGTEPKIKFYSELTGEKGLGPEYAMLLTCSLPLLMPA